MSELDLRALRNLVLPVLKASKGEARLTTDQLEGLLDLAESAQSANAELERLRPVVAAALSCHELRAQLSALPADVDPRQYVDASQAHRNAERLLYQVCAELAATEVADAG